MTLNEALIIAQRIEDDDVVGPVGMAIRVLLKDYRKLEDEFDSLQYDFVCMEQSYKAIT